MGVYVVKRDGPELLRGHVGRHMQVVAHSTVERTAVLIVVGAQIGQAEAGVLWLIMARVRKMASQNQAARSSSWL